MGAGTGAGVSRLAGGNRVGAVSIPRTGLGAPKHGKEDNQPHVGGNTWAGGTGGSDTAGLGGRGGAYRLDKGHTVHQVSDSAKSEVSRQAKAAAAQMARQALERRLKEIDMGAGEYQRYTETKARVARQIGELMSVLLEFYKRAREREWKKNQADGELDEARLVDGLTGERLIFRRRVDPSSSPSSPSPSPSSPSSGAKPKRKRLHFLVDCSASMYRFDSSDGRLSRTLETVLMLMEGLAALPADCPVEWAITGHSGNSPEIRLLDFTDPRPADERQRFAILERIVSHAQFCMSGDCTLQGLKMAIAHTLKVDHAPSFAQAQAQAQAQANRQLEGADIEGHVFALSDANFERYGIAKRDVSNILLSTPKAGAGAGSSLRAHLVLVASRDGEAEELARAYPANVSLALDSADVPKIFKAKLNDVFR